MVSAEENFELEKQMGCMAGIFQIFDRQHLLSGRKFGRHGQKRLPSGNPSRNIDGTPVLPNKSSQQATLEKTLSKSLTENSSLSMESSRASCSSSSSSSFSSVTETFFTEKPSKSTLKPKTTLDLRDIVKDSINRESFKDLTVKTVPKDELPKNNGLKHKDSPRPLLLSKSNDGTYIIGVDRSINNIHEHNKNIINNIAINNVKYCSRYSCDGRDNSSNNNVRIKDLPRLSLDSRKESLTRSNFDQNGLTFADSPGQHRRSNSLIARLMGLELLPDFNAEKPRRDDLLTRNNEIRDSKFENEILDCGNLVVKTKRIGSESEKNVREKMEFEFEIERKLREFELRAKYRVKTDKKGEKLNYKNEKSLKGFESPIVIMKPAKYNPKNRPLYLEERKNKSLKDREQGLKIKAPKSPRTPRETSPRISQKKGDLDRKLRPSNSANSLPDLGSPRGKISRPISPKAKKNLSRKLDEVEIATPRTSICKVIKQNAPEKEIAVVSPVSVLDASFYRDQSTPSFKDGETYTSEESWNPTSFPDTPPCNQIKSENIETLIQKLELLSSANEELPSGDLKKNKDREYIHEILLASGLLNKDLNFIVQSEYPINPDLFFVLEQTKNGEKNNRKLIFDLVNEILGQKLEPSFNSKWYLCTKKVGGKQLLDELCDEIGKIQIENSKHVELECGDEEIGEDFEISDEEMIKQMKGWEKFETEMQGMVFDIEKSIFRDLIDEIIEIETKDVRRTINNQRTMRRQLF